MLKTKKLKIAIVHDFLTQYGGAEKVLEVLAEIFPEAPIYTLLYDEEKLGKKFGHRKIQTSFLQSFPRFLRNRKRWLLPFMPIAPETFNLREYDLVISSSGAWSKGIITRLNTVHISYIHSPMRFVWDENNEYLRQQGQGKGIGFLARMFMNYIRIWDKVASDRPDFLIANSKYTQVRIKKYYGKEAELIYPPCYVTIGKQQEAKVTQYKTENTKRELHEGYGGEKQIDTKYKMQNTKHFLIVSRLSPYKKIDMAIEAFNKLELPLVVVGTGAQEKYLKSIARENIKFLGFQPEEKMEEIYAKARCFVFPGTDDFGIAPVEAMMHGVPVLAVRKGGAKEIVIEGETGEFFDSATPEVIADGVRRFIEKEEYYDREKIVRSVDRFDKEIFIRELENFIERKINL